MTPSPGKIMGQGWQMTDFWPISSEDPFEEPLPLPRQEPMKYRFYLRPRYWWFSVHDLVFDDDVEDCGRKWKHFRNWKPHPPRKPKWKGRRRQRRAYKNGEYSKLICRSIDSEAWDQLDHSYLFIKCDKKLPGLEIWSDDQIITY